MPNREGQIRLGGFFLSISGGLTLTAALCTTLVAMQSCGKRSSDDSSSLDDLAYDSEASNAALIFGARNGLAGVATDVQEMSRVLSDSTYGFSFSTESNIDSTKVQILSAISSKAATVGDKGTMALYFSGHGSPDGKFYTSDHSFLGFDEITQAIRKGRSGKPVKRVLIFNDSCFSGNWIDSTEGLSSGSNLTDGQSTASNKGRGSVELDEGSKDKMAGDSAQAIVRSMQTQNRNNEVFEQLLIMSASRDNETSMDLGVASGGAFTYSLRRVLSRLKADKPGARMKDMIQDTVTLTQSSYKHTPQFNAIPSIMLEGALFGRTPAARPPVVAPIVTTNQPPVVIATPQVVTPVAPTVTGPNASENGQMLSILGLINAQLEACEVKIDKVAAGANSQGWYRSLIHAAYADNTFSPKYYGWMNLRNTAEEEAQRVLKVIPGNYFPGCKRKLPSSVSQPFALETAHFAKTLEALNAKLTGCRVKLDKMTSGKDNKGIYRFSFSASYADGAKSEQRASWGQVSASAADETTAFLEAIPSRYFSKCMQK